tara:strand:+ start:130 stop:519 length:390 start_codon:yes stop_codon:yes gene_type:complete
MKLGSFVTLGIILFIILVLAAYHQQSQKHLNESIKIQITLLNKCELLDKAFMVSTVPPYKKAYFIDGKTSMFISRKYKIKLDASDKFPGFQFTSIPVEVSKNVTLTADCENSDRLEGIFESLRDQFKAD